MLITFMQLLAMAPCTQCCQGAEISAAKHKKGRKKIGEILPDFSKKGQKGAELFSSLVFHKIIYISCSKDYTYKLVYLSFLTTLDLEPLEKLLN
jgi:hypothetical protein